MVGLGTRYCEAANDKDLWSARCWRRGGGTGGCTRATGIVYKCRIVGGWGGLLETMRRKKSSAAPIGAGPPSEACLGGL